MKKCIYISAVYTSIIMFISCAQFGTPGGGPEDEDPPIIVKEESEPNFQTNFNKKEFRLVFNEWIQLSNPTKEVVISPPTDYPLKIEGRGKTVHVEFNEQETLRENATYQINFGDAIRDFTASNVYKNFVFVFSTGNEIDSLSISGTVYNAISGEAQKDILVCLYDQLSDSCFLNEKPFYFTKTDNKGKYSLNNIRNDTFQIFTLKDENVNYYYDLSSELVGFRDSFLVLADTNLVNIDLFAFDEMDPPRLVSYQQDYKGIIKLYYQPPPDSLSIGFTSLDEIDLFYEEKEDSIIIWHNQITSDTTYFIIGYGTGQDSILNRKSKQSARSIIPVIDKSVKSPFLFHHDDSLAIKINLPCTLSDTASIIISDTLNSYRPDSMFVQGRSLIIWSDSLKADHNYNLSIIPGSLISIYGSPNKDTLELQLMSFDPDKLGRIILNVINPTDTSYILQFKFGNNILQETSVTGNQVLEYEKLSKGRYTLNMIEDLDENRKWSPGKLLEKKKPEKIKELKLEELKTGWDLQLDIVIKDIFYGTEVGGID